MTCKLVILIWILGCTRRERGSAFTPSCQTAYFCIYASVQRISKQLSLSFELCFCGYRLILLLRPLNFRSSSKKPTLLVAFFERHECSTLVWFLGILSITLIRSQSSIPCFHQKGLDPVNCWIKQLKIKWKLLEKFPINLKDRHERCIHVIATVPMVQGSIQ